MSIPYLTVRFRFRIEDYRNFLFFNIWDQREEFFIWIDITVYLLLLKQKKKLLTEWRKSVVERSRDEFD